MSDQGKHHRPNDELPAEPDLRPKPERPEFTVEPLRTREEPPGSRLGYRLTLAAWVAVAIVFAGIAAVVALRYDAVRTALEASVQQQDPDASTTEVTDTVTVTLLGSGAVAAVVLVLAAGGLALASARKNASLVVLLVAGLAAIGASILFWSFMSEAGSIAAGVLQWGPYVAIGFAAIAVVSGCFARG